VEWRGLLEMLISRSEGVYVLQSVVCGLPWFPPPLEAALVTPFIVEGRHRGGTYICYVAFFGRGGMSEPCSLSLWRCGRWSGLVLRALERRAGHA